MRSRPRHRCGCCFTHLARAVPASLENPEEIVIENARWLPDKTRVVIFGPTARARSRVFVQRVAGGAPEAFTPEGVASPTWWAAAVSPDGARVTARRPDGTIALWSLTGDSPQPLPTLGPEYVPVEWSADGRSLVVARPIRAGWSLAMLRSRLAACNPSGTSSPTTQQACEAALSPPRRTQSAFVHSYSRLLVDLYVAEGLK